MYWKLSVRSSLDHATPETDAVPTAVLRAEIASTTSPAITTTTESHPNSAANLTVQPDDNELLDAMFLELQVKIHIGESAGAIAGYRFRTIPLLLAV